LLERTLDLTRAAPFAQRLLVLGAHASDIEAAVDTRGFTVVENPAYASGQASSLRAGLHAMSPNVDAAFVMLGDQPLVPAWLAVTLVDAFKPAQHVAVRPRYAGGPGNPVLLSRSLFAELEQLEGDVGARDVLTRHATRVLDVDLPDVPTPRDVDSEDDYVALLLDWSSTGAPDVPRYCQRCAAPLTLQVTHQRRRPVCPVCRFTYFFDPKLAVAVVVSIGDHIVLQRRAIAPGLGRWTFPGGFVDRGELPEVAAAREVWEEVGLSVERLRLMGVYSEPGETVALIAYHASADGQIPIVGAESSAVGVFGVADLPELAFSRDARVLADWATRDASPLLEQMHD
jgi:molybdenum cofactor cytidylyltransferase